MKKLQGAGLRGQSAGQTSLSTVEQEGSLRYLGYSIEDLAKNASFEETLTLFRKLAWSFLPNAWPTNVSAAKAKPSRPWAAIWRN